MLRSHAGPVESSARTMSDYQRTHELKTLQEFLTAPHNAKHVSAVGYFRLPGNAPPWHATGILLKAGESYSLFARGCIFWTDYETSQRGSMRPNLFGDPSFHLWARVSPGGKIKNLSEDSGSFIADCDGELELGIYMGMWADEFGHLNHTSNYQRLRGDISLVVAAWQTQTLRALSAINEPSKPTPPLIAAERARLGRQYQTPNGWQYLTETGTNEIFFEHGPPDSREISIDARNAQGIIRRPVDIPLSRSLTLSWQWRLDEHPSIGPEDRAHYHDYFSIGAEFDNGRDLTWIWSQYLEENHHFHCPVKDWTKRETHYVVRTQKDAHGCWIKDSRNVYQDVSISQGEPPAKIVAIWLIAVSTFSHQRLRAAFKDILLADETAQRVL